MLPAMVDSDTQDRMLADLVMTETAARAMGQLAVLRARLYIDEGLPLQRVLDTLHLSRASFYRRLHATFNQDALGQLGDALDTLRKANIPKVP
jgi:hypothetical protein